MKHWQKIGLAVIGTLMLARAAEAQTTLRFQFKADEKLNYVMLQKMKMSMNIMGKDIETQLNQTIDMSWNVIKVDADGSAQIKIAFTGVKMVMDGPTGKVEIDSKSPKQPDDPIGKMLSPVVAAIASMEMTMTMDKTGDIKEVKIPEKTRDSLKKMPGADAMGDLFTEEGMKRMVHGGIALPAEAITTGKTWSKKTDMKLPMGRFVGDTQFTYEGSVDKDGQKLEKIALKPTIAIEAAPDGPVQIKLSKQDGKGTMFFDNAVGRLAEVNATQVMEMTIDAGGMTIQQKIEQNMTMKLAK